MEEELRNIFKKHNVGFGEIDVDNAVKDILRLFNVSVSVCDLCKGTGWKPNSIIAEDCPLCGGHGEQNEH